jgi:hypothetical protein
VDCAKQIQFPPDTTGFISLLLTGNDNAAPTSTKLSHNRSPRSGSSLNNKLVKIFSWGLQTKNEHPRKGWKAPKRRHLRLRFSNGSHKGQKR